MKKLALSLPGFGETISNNDISSTFNPKITDLPSLITASLEVVFFVAGFLLLYMLLFGAFRYIYSGGNKEQLVKARSRIMWALIGFLVLIVSFGIAQYFKDVFNPTNVDVTKVGK